MIDHRVRAALRSDIAAHLLTSGGAAWSKVRERYPEISMASFWRIVREVKSAQSDALKSPEGEGTAEGDAKEAADADESLSLPLTENLSPFRLLAEYDRLLDDAEKLRKFAVDQQDNVIRPAAFMQSARLRERVLAAAVPVLAGLWDATAAGQYWEGLLAYLKTIDQPSSLSIRQRIRSFSRRPIVGPGAEEGA
jgi:hypothetical protein